MNPSEFLLARIAEEEALARAVLEDMSSWDNRRSPTPWEDDCLEVGGDFPGPQLSAHFSPARVLADCAARREIVWLYEQWERVGEERSPDHWNAGVDSILAELLGVYEDHPEYVNVRTLDPDAIPVTPFQAPH